MVARMPFVYWDSTRNRAQYQRRFPSDVQPLTGVWHRHKYPHTVSLPMAMELSIEKHLEFNTIVDAARQHLATPEGMIEALRGSRQRQRVMRERLLAVKDELAGIDGGIRRLNDEAAFYELGARLGMPMKIADAHKIVPVESVLNLWIAEVLAENKEPPPPSRFAASAGSWNGCSPTWKRLMI